MSTNTQNTYTKALTEIDNNFFLSVNELKLSMPKYFLHPDIEAYSNKYTKDMQFLKDSQHELFLLQNTIEMDLSNQDNTIEQINTQLNTLKIKNTKLNKVITANIAKSHAGNGALDDTIELYKQNNSGNWLLLIVILGTISYYYKNK
jgi:hypothetical protein